MKLEDFQVYNLSMELGEEIHTIVKDWNYFEKDTIGKQLVRSEELGTGLQRLQILESILRKRKSNLSRRRYFYGKCAIG